MLKEIIWNIFFVTILFITSISVIDVWFFILLLRLFTHKCLEIYKERKQHV